MHLSKEIHPFRVSPSLLRLIQNSQTLQRGAERKVGRNQETQSSQETSELTASCEDTQPHLIFVCNSNALFMVSS